MFFRKLFLPWTAAAAFETDDQFRAWLTKRLKLFSDLRMICLIPATLTLIIGYVGDNRPILILTVIPLAFVILLTAALDRMDAVLDGQNKPET